MPTNKDCFIRVNTSNKSHYETFSFLQTQVAQWQKLTSLIQPYLPHQGQWQVVCYQNGILTIVGQNHALITEIRYLHHQFVQQLRQLAELQQLEKIHVIQHNMSKPKDKKYTTLTPLSIKTCQNIRFTAEVTQHPRLKEALLQLAKHHETLTEKMNEK